MMRNVNIMNIILLSLSKSHLYNHRKSILKFFSEYRRTEKKHGIIIPCQDKLQDNRISLRT